MKILSEDNIESIKLSKVDFEGAGNEFENQCRLLFQEGTRIYWRKGGYLQKGIVEKFIGNACYPNIKVVNSRTNKVVKITVHDIDWDYMVRDAQDEAKS